MVLGPGVLDCIAVHCNGVGWFVVGDVGEVRVESVVRLAFLGLRPRFAPVPRARVAAAGLTAELEGTNVFSGAGYVANGELISGFVVMKVQKASRES
jgi:hypothetical protein